MNIDLNYPMRLFVDKNEDTIDWVAEFPDLPGCFAIGSTIEEAIAEAEICKNEWIEAAKADNDPIPSPSEIYSEEYSGKFNLRIPKTLHRELALRADYEGVSLNQLCTSFLSKSLAIETSRQSEDKGCFFRSQTQPQTNSRTPYENSWKTIKMNGPNEREVKSAS